MIQLELPVRNLEPSNVPIETVMLSIHNGCPLDCTYCFVPKTPDKMSLENARNVVDFLLRQRTGIQRSTRINFFGGEPFLAMDVMEEVLRYGNKPRPNLYHRFEFSATTSAAFATPQVEKIVRDAQMSLLISLDGTPQANAQRIFVSGRPSHDVVVENIRLFVKWLTHHKVAIRMTFFPNKHSLEFVKNVQHALSLGVGEVYLCPVVEANWDGWEERLEDAYQELADWFIAEMRAGRRPALEVTWNYLRIFHQMKIGAAQEASKPCNIGGRLIGIRHTGEITPCHRHHDRKHWWGDVEQDKLPEERLSYINFHSKDIERCADCPRAICGGGCRVLATEAGKGFYGYHPHHCLLTKTHARAVERIYATLMAENNKHFRSSVGIVKQGPCFANPSGA